STPFCVFKVTGLASTPLLAKVQSGKTLTEQEEKAWQRIKARVNNICETAHKKRVRIFIDGEETWIQKTIDDLAMQMMEKFNKELPIVYNTYQMYVASKLAQLETDHQQAVEKGFYLGAKLVRGAYMEKERERAEKMGYPDPIQPSKLASDKAFDDSLHFCVTHREQMAICAGTHNEQSSLLLTELMEKHGISKENPNFYFAQLYGMSDHISFNLANADYNVAKYLPYGPVKAVIPYLFRRADENTSVAGQSSREFSLIKKEMERRKK
ncbi:MAG: proline dehydrogenase, partial [Bacteroidia bacterium]